MKIDELRIGNYYRAGLEIKGSREAKLNLMDSNRVIQLTIQHFQFFANAPMIVEMITPIDLTDEWMLRLGFENEVIDSQEGILGFTKKYKGKYNNYFSDLYIEKSSNYYFISEFDFNFKYVHELQNIYYCLTGGHLYLS